MVAAAGALARESALLAPLAGRIYDAAPRQNAVPLSGATGLADTTQRAEAKARLVDAARRLLAGQIGVIEASRLIDAEAYDIDPEMQDEELLGFKGISSQTDHLAVGALLEEWHPSVREEKRREVLNFEETFRQGALEDAAVLIARYTPPA